MTPSLRIAAFIQGWEKCSLTPYRDGANLWTVGWGHMMIDTTDRTPITQEVADLQFEMDLEGRGKRLDALLLVMLSQNRFDACVSLMFNIGSAAFAGSTILKRLNGGYADDISKQFLLWDKEHVNGVLTFSKGLHKRRVAERAIYDDCDYSGRP